MKLSPLGRQALDRTVVDGVPCLAVLDLQTGKVRLIGMPPRAALERYGWAGEQRILFSVGAATRWFDRDAYATRLFAQEVTGDTPVFIGRRDGGLVGDDVLYLDPDGQSLLIALQRTPSEYPGVFRASLSSGGLQQVVAPTDLVFKWYGDGAGVVRAGIGTRPGAWFLLYRRTTDEQFRRVAQGEGVGRAAPLAGLRLQRDSDLSHVLSDAKTGRYALHQLDEALRGRINLVVSSSRDRKRLLVWSVAASQPGDIYLYEPDSGVLAHITNPVEWSSRDCSGRRSRRRASRTSSTSAKASATASRTRRTTPIGCCGWRLSRPATIRRTERGGLPRGRHEDPVRLRPTSTLSTRRPSMSTTSKRQPSQSK